MNKDYESNLFKRALILIILVNLCNVSFSQKPDTIEVPGHFSCGVTIAGKGISTLPNLTLGKPAGIFDLATGRKNLSFEPQLRFALEGKPWMFLIWWRYKLAKTGFPVSLSAMVNKRIKSDIPGDNDFIRNVSLRYFFSKDYIEK